MNDPMSKALRFRELHERPEPLLLPNPWDPGTARLLAQLGFEALATTSLGVDLLNVFDTKYPEIRASGYINPGAPRCLLLSVRFLRPN